MRDSAQRFINHVQVHVHVLFQLKEDKRDGGGTNIAPTLIAD